MTQNSKGHIFVFTRSGETQLFEFDAEGKQLKEFMAVHELDCRNDNQILAREISNWRVQKLVLHSPAGK